MTVRDELTATVEPRGSSASEEAEISPIENFELEEEEEVEVEEAEEVAIWVPWIEPCI